MVLSLYELAWKPAAAIVRRTDAEVAHDRTVELMRRADNLATARSLARATQRRVFSAAPVEAGGVRLPHALILAAGLVKGDGFADEATAVAAVARHHNIMPGSTSMAALIGAVELGSFTRHPRLGNGGRTLWRDSVAEAMQNRVGLRNPGARAAAEHLAAVAGALPRTFGISLAVTPGLDDLDASAREIEEAAGFFEAAFGVAAQRFGRAPGWYTLNLSCPNTEDDPGAHQTRARALRLAGALVERVTAPVWVKVGPDLGDDQLRSLVDAFTAAGVRAVVATNTLPRPVPGGGDSAGVSGAPLREHALRTVETLRGAIEAAGSNLDVIACGGILRGADLIAFQGAGARAAMLYSALVFRGPLAPALILREAAAEAVHAGAVHTGAVGA